MKKLFLFCLLFAGCMALRAAGFPQVSTDTEEYWYYLKFTQGSFVVTSEAEGTVCKASIPAGRNTQLWKVQGTAAEGYTFTNKQGQSLFLSGTAQGAEVRAALNPASMQKFKIQPRGSNYIITPFSNTNQAFNVWGGMGLRNDIKLYDSNDANAPMIFLAEDEVNLSGGDVSVVPYPNSVKMGEGVYDLHQLKGIEVPLANVAVPSGFPREISSPLLLLANRLKEDLYRTAAIDVKIKTDETAEWVGCAMVVDEALGEEAYRLSITADGIMLKASDYGGFFNGLQTLRQLMPTAIYGSDAKPDAAWTVPQLVIEDAPVLHHRGYHLDISRHFFDKEEVKKLLDMASVYKLNRFHWHLTDDQGWRVEIPEYPRLTTVGAVRSSSLTVYDPSGGNRFFDDTEYGHGCFYTLDDLREVVAYAAERNIQIIPEIDMPGHMTAALVAYPEFGCEPYKRIEVMCEGGVSRDILNIGRDETIDFLKCILGHVAEVFPFEYIHIGGDECPTTAWQSNDDCARRIQEEGLSSVNDLQPWLVETLGSFLRDKYGKTVVVWDELLDHWNKDYTVRPVFMAWHGADYAKQAAQRGYNSILVPTRPLYLDLLQVSPDQLEVNSPYMGGYGDGAGNINTVEKIYNFNPLDNLSGLTQYVLGTQGNLWTESCTSNKEAEYQYYPRLLAVSEIAWLTNSKKDFISFYGRLQRQASVLQAKDIFYAPHFFEPVQQSPVEAALAEAAGILEQSLPGEVGYPQVAAFTALQQAYEACLAAPENPSLLQTLQDQLAAYKTSPIVLPQAGQFYQVVSASTFFRNRFDGSTLYPQGTSLALHYTPQVLPEELWQFVPQEGGSYQMVSKATGNALTFAKSANGAIKVNKPTGSDIVIRQATKPATGISYIPGVVNIKSGRYNLYAKLSGSDISLVSSTDSTLCYPGTWRIVAVSDFASWLNHLVARAQQIVGEARNEVGQPTPEALQFLCADLIAPASELLAQGRVSQEEYFRFYALYEQYLAMPTLTVADLVDPSVYYLIRNISFSSYYAAADAANSQVVPKELADDDSYKWFIVKNSDGTVRIYNKETASPAFVEKNGSGQTVFLGQNYSWTLKEVKTEGGYTGVGILDAQGSNSWYTRPSSYDNIVLKTSKWDACIWELIPTDEEVQLPDGIAGTSVDNPTAIYDLSGRKVATVRHPGVYIINGKLEVIQ